MRFYHREGGIVLNFKTLLLQVPVWSSILEKVITSVNFSPSMVYISIRIYSVTNSVNRVLLTGFKNCSMSITNNARCIVVGY